MHITAQQLDRHYATERALLREYFPRADRRVINEYVEALRAYDVFPAIEALNRLVAAQHLIAASLPIIHLDS